jgi:hypothetical protein
MHQTFYIDIDEEITSIVEKLRKTEAPEAILVVPKRAMLIQSVVNLKLLRKEADALGLKISIVTQDKLGKMLIQKAGISIQQKVEDDYREEEENINARSDNPSREIKKEIEAAELESNDVRNKKRLEKIGSADYFISENSVDSFSERERGWEDFEKLKEGKERENNEYAASEKIVSRADLSGGVKNKATKRINVSTMDVSRPTALKREASRVNARFASGSSDDDRVSVANNSVRERANNLAFSSSESNDASGIPYSRNKLEYQKNNQRENNFAGKTVPKEQQLENFFYANKFSDKKEEDFEREKYSEAGLGKKRFIKILVILGAIILAGGSLYSAWLFFPKAEITIFAKKEVKSSDVDVRGDISYEKSDYEKLVIPAKLLEFDEEVAETFSASGKKNVSNKKAKGKITIYNEFSSSPQPLVATTRFLSEDQKIFRLVQGVTVPGTTKVGAETKPGVLEAEVVADEAGSGYNIGAGNFTIPGFKNSGNEKYAKIYAKSLLAMSGGGDGNEELAVVTDKDITSAKDKISLGITNIVKEKIKNSAQAGTVILDDAIILDEPVYRVSNSEGEIVESFEVKVSAHARAIVFSDSEIKKLANSVIAKSGNGKINIDSGSVIIDYGKSVVDVNSGTIEIKVRASNVMQPDLDLENLKKGILGKNSDELADYLRTYPKIEKAEVAYFPQLFVSKIPMNEKRVKIILESTMP